MDCLAGTLKCVTHPPWETLSTVLSALGTSLHSKDMGRRQQGIIYSQEQFPCHSQPEADSTHPEECCILVLQPELAENVPARVSGGRLSVKPGGIVWLWKGFITELPAVMSTTAARFHSRAVGCSPAEPLPSAYSQQLPSGSTDRRKDCHGHTR